MKIADDALGAENFLTIELENDAQHTVSGGMLRTHINDEFIRIEKSLVAIPEFKVRNIRARIAHWPLSIPRLACTHSLSC